MVTRAMTHFACRVKHTDQGYGSDAGCAHQAEPTYFSVDLFVYFSADIEVVKQLSVFGLTVNVSCAGP
jgi:hypothetical protein